MARVPVRIGPGRLKPDLAQSFPWRCGEHIAAGEGQCSSCCGGCYWLAPGEGCQLGSMRPIRCKTYPLIPQRNRVIIHGSCPDNRFFLEKLWAGDERALALLDVAVAFSDLLHDGGDDQSAEVEWLMEYTQDGFGGPVVWRRDKGIIVPDGHHGGARGFASARESAAPKQGRAVTPRDRRKV